MRSTLSCLTGEDPDAAEPDASAGPPPCQIAVNAVLDILEAAIRQRSQGGAVPLRLEDIQEVIAQTKQAPEQIRRLYESAQQRCRVADDDAEVLLLEPDAPASAPAPAPAREGSGRRGVGRLQTIGLDSVREELGPRWEAVADRVRATALGVIRRGLAPNDSVLRDAGGDFVICFAELTGEAAWLKAKAIEQEIRERLIGTEGDSAVEDLQLTFETLSGIAELQSETHDLDLGAADLADESEVGALVAAKLEEASRAIRAQTRDHLEHLKATWSHDLREVQVASGAPARLMVAEPDARTRMVLERLRGAAGRDPAVVAKIDLLAIGAAADLLAADTVLGDALLAVEIHASTVLRRANYELFLASCQGIPQEVRDRLVLIVGAVPRDAYPPTLADTLRLLKGFARVTALRLPLPRLNGFDLRAAGVPLLVLAESTASAMLHRTPRAFGRFLQEVKLAGGRLLVDRVARPEAVERLAEAGIELWSTAGT